MFSCIERTIKYVETAAVSSIAIFNKYVLDNFDVFMSHIISVLGAIYLILKILCIWQDYKKKIDK